MPETWSHLGEFRTRKKFICEEVTVKKTSNATGYCPWKAGPILKYSRVKIAKMQHPEIVQIPVLTVSLANIQQKYCFLFGHLHLLWMNCFKFSLLCLFIWLRTGRALQYRGRIQRKTWSCYSCMCMGPYAGVDYNLTFRPLQSFPWTMVNVLKSTGEWT